MCKLKTYIASFLIFFCVIFPVIVFSGQLFEEESALTESERLTLESQSDAVNLALKALDEMRMLFALQQMQSGDCEDVIEIDDKAKKGDPFSQYFLGSLYKEGLCVKKDEKIAFEWVKKSAELGYADAQVDLAAYYINGIGTDINNVKAAEWFQKAAEQNEPEAQSALGRMYQEGLGLSQNYDQALKWYKLAAENGLSDVYAKIALVILKIYGDLDGAEKALHYSILGATYGSQLCQYLASAILSDSSAGKLDLIEAHKWANLAAVQSFNPEIPEIPEKAKKLRDEIEKIISPSDLQEAQLRAGNWKVKYYEKDQEKSKDTEKYVIEWENISVSIPKKGLSSDEAKNELNNLGIPITRDYYFKSVENDSLDVFRLFLYAGANIEEIVRIRPNVTSLYVAVDWGSKKVYRYLMDHGANVNVVAKENGMTPLVRAIAHNRWDMVDELINSGASAKMQDSAKGTLLYASPLSYALMDERENLTKKLLDRGASVNERYSNGDTPLHNAARKQQLKNVSVLINAGANTNAKNDFGVTPLIKAIENEQNINIKIIQLLLTNGANPAGNKSVPATPLFYSALLGNNDLIILLKKHGVNINEKYYFQKEQIPMNLTDEVLKNVMMNGGTPLMIAIMMNHLSSVKKLVDLGADLNYEIKFKNNKYTAYKLAEQNGNTAILKYLK